MAVQEDLPQPWAVLDGAEGSNKSHLPRPPKLPVGVQQDLPQPWAILDVAVAGHKLHKLHKLQPRLFPVI